MRYPLDEHTVEAALRMDGYPEISVREWQKFRNRAATLYPYMMRDDGTAYAVETPLGSGVLVAVLGPWARVLLSSTGYDEDHEVYPTTTLEARTVSPAEGTREELDANADNRDGRERNRLVVIPGGKASKGGRAKANARPARRKAGRHADPDDGQATLVAFGEAEEAAGDDGPA